MSAEAPIFFDEAPGKPRVNAAAEVLAARARARAGVWVRQDRGTKKGALNFTAMLKRRGLEAVARGTVVFVRAPKP